MHKKTRAHYVMVAEDDPQFRRFWDRYPRRASKKDARRAWAKVNPPVELVDQMIAALEWQIPLHKWDGEKYDYAPYPASWINGARWEDSPPPIVRQKVMGDAAAMVFETLGVRP
jgi:hypothetical protein